MLDRERVVGQHRRSRYGMRRQSEMEGAVVVKKSKDAGTILPATLFPGKQE